MTLTGTWKITCGKTQERIMKKDYSHLTISNMTTEQFIQTSRINSAKICPSCLEESKVQKLKGRDIYNMATHQALENITIYVCDKCGSRVGTHRDTDTPLGSLADFRLQTARKQTHHVFDKLWKKNYMDRSSAYVWLSGILCVHPEWAHIGMLDADQCGTVIVHANRYMAMMDKFAELKTEAIHSLL